MEQNNKPAQYMIHLKYKCKVNFVKFDVILTVHRR